MIPLLCILQDIFFHICYDLDTSVTTVHSQDVTVVQIGPRSVDDFQLMKPDKVDKMLQNFQLTISILASHDSYLE